ncbi:signal peptidase I [Govanella unica]|uniref:Signal peptidase I n=1 Tax=Govanella unica TaxID=2975056 RepID=A0A9X3Z7K6_9PROT|nr:signal peptidase I [Govania unica]MDA5194267.1 signal peptidase I [Govania unica]
MEKKVEGSLGETLRTIGFALLIAIVFRSFVYQPFNIPSESMVPTLLVGDYLFVSKFAYGYSRHSLPFSPPIFDGRIFEKPVKRGDVVVFKLPRDNSTDYIKRIVGLPGDRVQMRDGVLFLNDQPVKRERVTDFVADDPNLTVHRAIQYRETLPNGVSYNTLDLYGPTDADNTPVFEVPKGYYFAMGDNRDNSADSRLPMSIGVGFVPAENLLGKAEIITFSTDGGARLWEFWKWLPSMRFSRFFKPIY